MTTAYIADTGVFVRCGGPDKAKFQRLRRALRQTDISLRVPQRVYVELGGDPAADEYPREVFRILIGLRCGSLVGTPDDVQLRTVRLPGFSPSTVNIAYPSSRANGSTTRGLLP